MPSTAVKKDLVSMYKEILLDSSGCVSGERVSASSSGHANLRTVGQEDFGVIFVRPEGFCALPFFKFQVNKKYSSNIQVIL